MEKYLEELKHHIWIETNNANIKETKVKNKIDRNTIFLLEVNQVKSQTKLILNKGMIEKQ